MCSQDEEDKKSESVLDYERNIQLRGINKKLGRIAKVLERLLEIAEEERTVT